MCGKGGDTFFFSLHLKLVEERKGLELCKKGESFFFLFFAVVSFSSGLFVRGPSHFQTGNLNFFIFRDQRKIFIMPVYFHVPPGRVREGGKREVCQVKVDEPCFGNERKNPPPILFFSSSSPHSLNPPKSRSASLPPFICFLPRGFLPPFFFFFFAKTVALFRAPLARTPSKKPFPRGVFH